MEKNETSISSSTSSSASSASSEVTAPPKKFFLDPYEPTTTPQATYPAGFDPWTGHIHSLNSSSSSLPSSSPASSLSSLTCSFAATMSSLSSSGDNDTNPAPRTKMNNNNKNNNAKSKHDSSSTGDHGDWALSSKLAATSSTAGKKRTGDNLQKKEKKKLKLSTKSANTKNESPRPTEEMIQNRKKHVVDFIDMSRGDSVRLRKLILDEDETLSSIQAKCLFSNGGKFKTYPAVTSTPFSTTTTKKMSKVKVEKTTNMVTGSLTKSGTGRKAKSSTVLTGNNLIDLMNAEASSSDDDMIDKMNETAMEFEYEIGDDGSLKDCVEDDSDSYMDGAGEVEEVGNGLGETLGPDFEAETVLAYQRAKKAWRHVLPPDCSSLNTKFQFWGSKEPPLSNNAKVNEEKDIKWQLCKFKNNPPPRGCRYIINSAGAPLTFNRWTNTNDIMKARLNVVCGGCLKDKFNCGEMVHGRFVTQAMFAFMDENIRKQRKVTRAQAEAAYKNSFNEHKRTITWIKSPKDERTYDPKTYEPPECMKKASFLVCMAIYDHCKDKGNHNNPINLSSVLRETHDNFHSFLKMDKIIHHLLWPNLKYVPCTPGAF